jgi:hypothetical protein
VGVVAFTCSATVCFFAAVILAPALARGFAGAFVFLPLSIVSAMLVSPWIN